MKTIEEKAEAYDMAIERAKRMFSEKELNYLFPELHESEDDKIRKEIIDFIDTKTIDSDERRNKWFSYLGKQGEQKFFDYENANIPQKDSTWSEEDKHWMQKVIDFMNHPDLIKATPTLAKDTINWLKSLKDRVQPQSKQEWSEEDEGNFQGIIDVIKENKHHAIDYEHITYYKLLSWFKSLKDRYTWKPSEEQMHILSIYAHVHDGLSSLYQDLKKLKG